MKDTELRQERDRELFRLYNKGLREEHFSNMKEAADWVRNQPAPKFYISSKALVNYIGAMIRGSTPPKMFAQNRKKMKILYGMYMEFIAENPSTNLSRDRICEILVEQPAPMFFICQESCIKAILRERKKFLRG